MRVQQEKNENLHQKYNISLVHKTQSKNSYFETLESFSQITSTKNEEKMLTAQDLRSLTLQNLEQGYPITKSIQQQFINVLLIGDQKSQSKKFFEIIRNEQDKKYNGRWKKLSEQLSTTSDTLKYSFFKRHNFKQNQIEILFPNKKIVLTYAHKLFEPENLLNHERQIVQTYKKFNLINNSDILLFAVYGQKGYLQTKYGDELSFRIKYCNLCQLITNKPNLKIIIVITYSNDIKYEERQFKKIKKYFLDVFVEKFGISDHRINFVPVDISQKSNIFRSSQVQYKGQSIYQTFQKSQIPHRNEYGPLRISISRIEQSKQQIFVSKKQSVKNSQFWLTGRILNGKIIDKNLIDCDTSVQLIVFLCNGKKLKIRVKQIIRILDNKRVHFAFPTQQIKLRVIMSHYNKNQKQEGPIINISDAKFVEQFVQGSVISDFKNLSQIYSTNQFKAEITIYKWYELLPCESRNKLLCAEQKFTCLFPHNITEYSCTKILKVQAYFDENMKKMVKSTYLLPQQKGIAIIKLENPICIQKSIIRPELGKFYLLNNKKIIGEGQITKIKSYCDPSEGRDSS